MMEVLAAAVKARISILIAGGTGAGKTTFLNILSQYIPNNERLVTIEDAAELRLAQENIVRLETRPPNIEGQGAIRQRQLLINCLRMRPDRIIIGEIRGEEAFDMLQAMNTGHEGSMATVHANSPRDALRRVENMVSMAGLNYPISAIRQQMASAIDILVQLGRLTGGRRKVINISEVTGTEGDAICLQDLFQFRQSGVSTDGDALGHFECCGVRPRMLDKIRQGGVDLPEKLFQRRTLVTQPGKTGQRPANGAAGRQPAEVGGSRG
jgi:pilus assembly protein CpaF